MNPTPVSSTPKLGPGAYRPDVAFRCAADLPAPKVVKVERLSPQLPCPHCGNPAPRHKVFTRLLHDLGDLATGRPHDLRLFYSQHHCARCATYFNADATDLAPPGGHYTHRVMTLAVRVVVEDGLPYRTASWHLWRDHRVFVPFATIQNWVEQGGKRARERWDTDYLDWALAEFSGYLAADELYDGPFCVLSLVDNQTYKHVFYQVLEHDATQADILAFFQHFQEVLTARQLTVKAITTDGSPLYPEPIRAVFGEIPHQLCIFHILQDLNQAVLRAVAQVRKQLAAQQPKLGRGRPSGAKRKLARQRQRLQQKIADLFEFRHLFVQHHLSPSEHARLLRITRGLPHLRTLRAIVDEIYRLFDRRCRTATALRKLAHLRQRVQRFGLVCQILKGLFAANVEKALTFLDDRELGATSNAVERANRRYRKMQHSVYRVRGYVQIVNRLALDLFREAAASAQVLTLALLHAGRVGPPPRQ